MLLRELPAEKFWSFPSSYTKEKRENEISNMILSKENWFQTKIDGNYSAFICDFDGEKRLISRGLSKTTGEYGRLEDKVFFFNDVAAAFDKPTRIMGEIWLEGAVDKGIGSILRCSSDKAKSIQDNEYYENIKTKVKFTAKDKRDIEGNEFRGQKLHWYIFDVWYYNGEDLMDTPWIKRQKYVKEAVKKINNPLVTYAESYLMDDNFYDTLAELFQKGEEGVVCYSENGKPAPGKRVAHKSLKIKRELENVVDAFITGIEPSTRLYNGEDPVHWCYWEDSRTGEKLYGEYYGDYQLGKTVVPVSKGYWLNVPGAIYTAVYDKNGNEIPLCKVSGLTDDFKVELRDNYEKYDHTCVSIGGMALSDSNGISIRHPRLVSIRTEDLSPEDCTLEKIIGG